MSNRTPKLQKFGHHNIQREQENGKTKKKNLFKEFNCFWTQNTEVAYHLQLDDTYQPKQSSPIKHINQNIRKDSKSILQQALKHEKK